MPDAPKTCDLCGRTSWAPAGGMGGGLHPSNHEEWCINRGGMWCRVAREGRKAALAELGAAMPTAEELSDLDDAVPAAYYGLNPITVDAYNSCCAWMARADKFLARMAEMAGEEGDDA